MRPKILHFTWSVWKWVATLDVLELISMNVAIESAHCGCEINLCKDWTQSKRCGKYGRIWSKAEHCIKVWYSDSRTCLGQSVHRRPLSSLVPQCPVSNRNASELSHMEAMVRMADNGMGSNMYRCLRFQFGHVKDLLKLLKCYFLRGIQSYINLLNHLATGDIG